MARRNHFVGALAESAGILTAVRMLMLVTLVIKEKPAQAQDYPCSGADFKERI
jgi:hypothetical protein